MPEGPDTRRGKSRLLWGLQAVPVLLILIGAALWIWAPLQYLQIHSRPPGRVTVIQPPATQELPPFVSRLSILVDELVRSREAMKERLDAISQQAGQVQWLLSIVIGVAGLLTLAQGLFAFFSAQNYMKQAADAVQRIEELEPKVRGNYEKEAAEAVKKFKEFEKEVRNKYPIFSEMEQQRKVAFSLLADRGTELKVTENLYRVLNPVERQEIFALENFAAFQFRASSDSQPGVIAGLGILGRFYKDKFEFESERALRTDFERAQYYFTLAVEKSKRADISALNDLGSLLYWTNESKIPLFSEGELGSFREGARELFRESLAVCADQQRALYNLGNTFFDERNFEEALRCFQKAAKAKNWERSPDPDMSSYVHYNIACTYSRLSGNEKDAQKKDDLLALALKALGEAAEVAAPPRLIVDADLKSGDLKELARSERFSPQLARIKESFERGWTARALRG